MTASPRSRSASSPARRSPEAVARALWYTAPQELSLETHPLPPLTPDTLRVRTQYSAISRGTERLVFNGSVPRSEWPRMQAPHQEGTFPFPVKYGYSTTGIVESGPSDWLGKAVFGLFPHQDLFDAAPAHLHQLPDAVPLKRATLAANMETALNALWDGGAGPCEKIVVVGAGIVGLLTAYLAAKIPGTTVTIIDPLDARGSLAQALGVRFASPDMVSQPEAAAAPRHAAHLPHLPRLHDADLVIHTSATAQGLETAISCAGFEATVIELSWYGDKVVSTSLGGAFHSRRLKLMSSQVGTLAQRQRSRWSHNRRMAAAINLLADPVLDCLVEDEISFNDVVTALPAVFSPEWTALPPIICYQ